MSKGVRIAVLAIVVLALMGGSFYGGKLYGEKQAESAIPTAFRDRMAQFTDQGGQLPQFSEGDQSPQPGQGFAQGRFGGQTGQGGQGGGLMGQITQNDGNTLVISGMDGVETKVQVTDTTLIEKYASVSAADLEVGEQVIVSGSQNDDGSMTARSIQVAEFGRFVGGGGAPTQGNQ